MRDLTVVMLEWRDSAQYPSNEWKSAEQEFHPMVMRTAGLLVHEDEGQIVLAVDWTEARDETPWRNVSVVPRENVVREMRLVVTPEFGAQRPSYVPEEDRAAVQARVLNALGRMYRVVVDPAKRYEPGVWDAAVDEAGAALEAATGLESARVLERMEEKERVAAGLDPGEPCDRCGGYRFQCRCWAGYRAPGAVTGVMTDTLMPASSVLGEPAVKLVGAEAIENAIGATSSRKHLVDELRSLTRETATTVETVSMEGLSNEEFDALTGWARENGVPMATVVCRAVRSYLHLTPKSQV